MADIQINELLEATTAADSDWIAIDNGSATKKISVENFNATGAASAAQSAAAAAQSATDAGTAKTAAEQAKDDTQALITSAQTIVSNASDYADAASTSAGTASTAANTATAQAAIATNQATLAAGYATNVDSFAKNAKSWAVGGTGTRSGEDTDNSKYYSQQAHDSEINAAASESNASTSETNAAASESTASSAASSASADALKAEGYAVGTQNGTPAASGETYYQDNAKYYKEQAATSETNAASSEYNAGLSETAAAASESAAKDSEEDSEAWAWGKINGVDVPSTHPAYHNNAKYWADSAGGAAGGGVTSFNGRSGIVSSAAHDYSADMIDFDNTGTGMSATDVDGAILEVKTDLSTLVSSLKSIAETGEAIDVSYNNGTSGLIANNVQNAIDELTEDLSNQGTTIGNTINTLSGKAYQTDDTAETTIDDSDYVPFYDSSATAKRRSLWSNIKSVLKTYFDTLYKGISAHDAWSDVTSKPFSTVGSGLTVTSDTMAADVQSVTVGSTGTASASAVSYQRIGVNGTYYEIDGTKYMEQTVTTSTSADVTATFTHSDITTSSEIVPFFDVWGIAPSNIATTPGQCVVTIPKQSTAFSLGVRIRIR